ncbi:hypothetical protein OG897_21485 [Streptomyces sp. NBC_00237]|uniref:hypothetical protein n=1 Tax=Streptomyces sp. NBC_00237 TaxID=2975687 RepID=UPI00225A77CA|nr:hypothetical protein [Streptomyces sp. NBC_00237]MCX5204011.1 hypothetical protein [Streptomyces sp. NBC_00237]
MFEILPDRGVVLPRGAGELFSGTSERAAQWAVATLCDVRETWVCGLEWSFGATYEGLELLVGGEDVGGLTTVCLERVGPPLAPAAVPVVLDGVDVCGFPQDEVGEALADGPAYRSVKLWRSHLPDAYLHAVHLSFVSSGRSVSSARSGRAIRSSRAR